jgi:hypothetical protein
MTALRISEARVSPSQARSVQLSCPRCGHLCECRFPYQATAEQMMKIRHEVMAEHARICSAGYAEVAVVYPIEYPRG